MSSTGSITIILHETRSAVNVGAAARAMANFGLRKLLLTNPSGFDQASARRVAAEAAELLETAEVAPSLEEVWSRFERVIVTSAKNRADFTSVTPQEAMRSLRALEAQGASVALVFGNETRGLPRWVLDRAHMISSIPSDPQAPSLNLAQAVLLHAFVGSVGEAKEPVAPQLSSKTDPRSPEEPRLSAQTIELLRRRGRALLLEVGFLDPQSPDRVFYELERLLLRGHPSEREGGLMLSLFKRLEHAVARYDRAKD